MILTGHEIHKRVQGGTIEITPFNEKQLNPASYDLRLGGKVAWYIHGVLDTQKPCQVLQMDIPEQGFKLDPNELYLMHTEEIVCAHDTVPIVDGKSSLGRLGISVHQTAGFGDPGFRGQYTLEVTVVNSVIVYAGMRFCQIRFHEVHGLIQRYAGNYQGNESMGPVASRSWKQFEGEK